MQTLRQGITRTMFLTDDLLEQIKNKDYFYRKAKKFGNLDDWNIAKYLRNQTNKNIRKAKSEYVTNQLHACRGDSAKFWHTIKTVFPSKKHKDTKPIRLKHQHEQIDPDTVADYINQFFLNVGNKPVTDLHLDLNNNNNTTLTSQSQSLETSQIQIEQLFSLEPVTCAEIFRLTDRLNPRKSSGLNNISTKVLRDGLLALNNQFTHIINTSISKQTFPAEWKNAKVIPIPKTGDLTQVSNYRPISLLPIPGKVLEKVVHTQLEDYLEEGELINEHQFGFRKYRSTINAIHQLTNHININLNNRVPTVAVFIDFRKAFDCLQYPVLLTKLKDLNLDKDTVEWVSSYLSARHQRVMANGTTSGLGMIRQGVPQGSILGPLLYTLYANDIGNIIKKSKFAFYADDTVIYSQLDNLMSWCQSNNIFINPSKTKFMIFSSQELAYTNIRLAVNNLEIERVPHYNYLGMVLDQHLTFENHTKYTINRVSPKIYQLAKMRKYLTSKAALLVYKNMILPILEYGDIFLSSATCENRKKLQRLQNKALKCALATDKTYSTNRLHIEAKLLKLKHRRKIHLLLNMHKLSHMPNFKGWKHRTGTRTRSSKKKLMTTKKPKLTKFQNSISYRGPKAWNSLPAEIQKTENHELFKSLVKAHQMKKWQCYNGNLDPGNLVDEDDETN